MIVVKNNRSQISTFFKIDLKKKIVFKNWS